LAKKGETAAAFTKIIAVQAGGKKAASGKAKKKA
jgi:hypothetical protein